MRKKPLISMSGTGSNAKPRGPPPKVQATPTGRLQNLPPISDPPVPSSRPRPLIKPNRKRGRPPAGEETKDTVSLQLEIPRKLNDLLRELKGRGRFPNKKDLVIWILWKHVHANPHSGINPIPESRMLAIEARIAALEDKVNNPNPLYIATTDEERFQEPMKLSDLVSMALPELMALAAQHGVDCEGRAEMITELCSVLEAEDDMNTEENDND